MPAFHRFAGILSAVGIHLADIVQESQEPAAVTLSPDSMQQLQERLHALEEAARQKLLQQGFKESQVHAQRFLNLRWGLSAACLQ